MTILIIFLLSFAISFVGSLQPGTRNMAVIGNTLSKGVIPGIKMALGSSLPEIIYSSIPLFAQGFYDDLEKYSTILKIVTIGVMLSLSIYFFLKAKTDYKKISTAPHHSFIKGLLLGMIHPQTIIFYSLVIAMLKTFGIGLEDPAEQYAFVSAAFLGTIISLLFFVFLTNRFAGRLVNFYKLDLNKIMATILLVLAVCLSIITLNQ